MNYNIDVLFNNKLLFMKILLWYFEVIYCVYLNYHIIGENAIVNKKKKTSKLVLKMIV